MPEMVTRAQADTLFLLLLVLGIIAAPIAGLLARRRGGDAVSAVSAVSAALLWGGPLFLIGVLWRVYNAITDRIGLDSVANLAVNFGLFVLIGLACGFGWTVLTARDRKGVSTEVKSTTEV